MSVYRLPEGSSGSKLAMKPPPLLLLFLLNMIVSCQPISAIDFVFNGFNSSSLLLYGNATIESNILSLTNRISFAVGRALYPSKIPTKAPNSSYVYPFSTSFIFAMAPYKNVLPGHGFVFIFAPFTGIDGTNSAQNLGLFNRTNDGKFSNHVFGVEFDVFANQEFNDINDNHVGIDLNSLTSKFAEDAGYWPDNEKGNSKFKELKLNNGRLIQSHKILAWSFSNSNFALSESLITTGLPSFVLPKDPVFKSKGFIAGATVASFLVIVLIALIALFYIRRKQRRARARADMEDWELEYWPHRITYQEIEAATKGFSEDNVIGVGGNGKVFKGVLPGGTEVAVKRISHENDGMREFLAEISSLGRLKHRSLVGLRGWCKREKGSFMLVYDYMENGSLDKRVFDCEDNKMLSCEERIRILKDVASGVLYLHEGWESKVLHRDIKASNVLLDKEMNGRLGDFGLARMHSHGQLPSTTRVVGTVGYLAPEVVRSGRASAQTDVFGFGVLILEVMCGRRPIEEGKPPLVELVWKSMMEEQLLSVFDPRLKARGGFDEDEVERVLHLGLLCTYPEPSSRPTMRQVLKILEGKNESNEAESEDIDAYLLQQMNSETMWMNYSESSGFSSHPTFEEIRKSKSSSMSFSWTNSVVEDFRSETRLGKQLPKWGQMRSNST
ncbi:hypothetical protein MANES_17G046200v8 [Manihot esculenta]|uniref:Uncharacterized protein n=1 Tax=Manihot esculenta TaxID=3983 RepID=A0ACB7G351_MANES|nr:hypothetical protein MANES_17G046200v8 [Manihot esculenta]